MDHVRWDDLRVFLAVAREGTVRRAAAVLGTSHSTVLRRVDALEEGLDARLFHRRREGYVLTGAGERALEAAVPLEDRVHDIRRQVKGGDARLSGRVRVTLPDALLPHLLRALRGFEAAYPGITLELSTSTRFADLERGEADVAVRIATSPPSELVGRRVAHERVGVYGSKRYLRRARGRALGHYDWIGWEEHAATIFGTWIDERIEPSRVRLRLATLPDLVAAVAANLGVTLLPRSLGDTRAGLTCIESLEEMTTPVWVLSHSDLKNTARVRAVRDFISETLSADHA